MAGNSGLETNLALLREQRWSEVDARVVLAQFERSGDSVLAFARAHGLNAQRIYWWRSRLSERVPDDVRQDETELDELSFAPVVVTGLGQTKAVVLRLGELEIEVVEPQKVEPIWLAQVLAAAKGVV